MTYLFSEEGRRALRMLVTRPILYAFDFDGTLAPISANRDGVRIPRSVAELLRELAQRVPCAIVSGRSLADLMPRVNGTVPYVIGNHGIESPLTPTLGLAWCEGICLKWMQEFKTRLAESLKTLDAEVEDKQYSITVHLRGTAVREKIRLAIKVFLENLSPAPHLIPGKSSVNVLPLGQRYKGAALLDLMVNLRQTDVFYVGDDDTDESVFALKEGLTMGVRIGHHAESQAKYYLSNQGEVEELLRFLVDRMPESLA